MHMPRQSQPHRYVQRRRSRHKGDGITGHRNEANHRIGAELHTENLKAGIQQSGQRAQRFQFLSRRSPAIKAHVQQGFVIGS